MLLGMGPAGCRPSPAAERRRTMGSTGRAGSHAGVGAIAPDGGAADAASVRSASGDGVMRAIVQERYGSADVLRSAEIDRPDIGPNEVLVHVRAAGMDRGTWHSMTGR